MKMIVRPFLAGAALLAIAGCAQQSAPEAASSAVAEAVQEDWDAFVADYIEETFRRSPTFAIGSGRHEFDGQIDDFSPAKIAGDIGFYERTIGEARNFADRFLTAEQRFERDYLISNARGNLFWLQTAEQPFTNPAFYGGALSPSTYTTVPYAPAEERLAAYTEYLRNIPRAAEQIRANLRTPMPATFVDLGIATFQGYADYFRGDARQEFSEVEDPALWAAHDAAMRPAADAMSRLAEWLRGEVDNATDDYALGAERFARMLRDTEGVDIPLAELEEMGRADLERNQRALGEACAEFAPGLAITRCIELAGENKPEEGAVQGARNQLAGLKQFILDNDIVTVPSQQEAFVEEAPPYRRRNLAYINIPGPFESDLPSVYYIAPPDPSWTEEVQRAYIPGEADLLFISVHEVWPGHFLNFLHAERSDLVFGRLFVGYAYAEGWAHYTEEMMWDAGLRNGDPETHIGQLTNALLRNVRFLSAIGLHSGTMTVEESRQMFLEDGYQSAGSAEQQAARGTYDPGYLNYTLGKLMIMQLREDWTASRGGRTAWKDFHDAFLSYGGPPIPLVRQAMLGEDVPRAVLWAEGE